MRIMTYSGLDNFYLTHQQLQNLPSHRDGIDAKRESALRFAGSLLIREIGIKLGQPQPVMATGQRSWKHHGSSSKLRGASRTTASAPRSVFASGAVLLHVEQYTLRRGS